MRLYKATKGVSAELSRTLYRYAEVLTGNTFTTWQDIVAWLEPEYKFKVNSPSSQIIGDAHYSHRSSRSLAASNFGRSVAKNALLRRRLTRSALAEESCTSLSTINRFFAGQRLDRENFMYICRTLNLKWEEIAAPENDVADEPNELEEIKLKSVKYMLKLGGNVEQIAQILNLTVEQVTQATLKSS